MTVTLKYGEFPANWAKKSPGSGEPGEQGVKDGVPGILAGAKGFLDDFATVAHEEGAPARPLARD